MKKILTLILFLPLLAHAQDGVLSDTSYIENRAGQFWQVRTQVYDSGRNVREELPYGSDTTAVVNALIGSVFSQLSQYASAAATVQSQYARQRQAERGVSQAIMQLIGVNYSEAVSSLIGDELVGNYSMRVNGSTGTAASIVRLANGSLRYRQGGTNFPLDVLGRNWIRIRRYDGSAVLTPDANVIVDLFLVDGINWVDMTQGIGTVRYRLRKQ